MPEPPIYNKNIFISYSRKNRARCDELAAHLGNAGYLPWCDKEIDPGDKWWQRICEEIEQCQILLILLEPGISNSLYCEGAYATALGRHIVPAEILPLLGPQDHENKRPRPACPKTPAEQLNDDYRAELRDLIDLIGVDLPHHEQFGECVRISTLIKPKIPPPSQLRIFLGPADLIRLATAVSCI